MSSSAVVVVNYNDARNLRVCLASMPADAEVVVVDNASPDRSAEMVRREFPHVLVVDDGTNPGYGAGANKGVRACRADYALVLNSDTRLEPGTLDVLRAYLDRHPEVGLVGPRLVYPDGSPQASVFPFPGTLRWLVENDPVAPVAGLFPPVRSRLYRFSPPPSAGPVPWVLGAAIAVRREAFEAVGGFDESFFLYFEEVDLCLRLARAGWETHFVPHTTVMHVGGTSTGQVRAGAALEHFRSNLRFYGNHYRGVRLAFWRLVMRVKMLYRLARDGAALAVTRESLRRARLREEVIGWSRAVRHRG
jgi:GT2 family glycosyltransferase